MRFAWSAIALLWSLCTPAATLNWPLCTAARPSRSLQGGISCSAKPVPAASRTTADSMQGLKLLDSYAATTDQLLQEIAATEEGEEIFFQLYLFEDGLSSERVLAALLEAGSRRGVLVKFGLDVSYGTSHEAPAHTPVPGVPPRVLPPGAT
jgi:hypothetical protein